MNIKKSLPEIAVFGTTQIATLKFGENHDTYLGGNGLLSALAIAKKQSVYLISAIGNDLNLKYLNQVIPKNLKLEFLEVIKGITFHIDTEYDELKQELRHKSINFGVYENYFPKPNIELLRTIKKLHLGGTDPEKGLYLLNHLDLTSVKIISSGCLMYFLESKFEATIKLFKYCNIIFASEQEYEIIKSKIKEDLFSVLPKLELIIVTQGKNGVRYLTKGVDKSLQITNEVTVKNPANAGDVLAGSFINQLNTDIKIDEQDIDQMLNFAQSEAAIVISNNKYYRILYEKK